MRITRTPHTAAALGPQRPSRVEEIWGPESFLSHHQQLPTPHRELGQPVPKPLMGQSQA